MLTGFHLHSYRLRLRCQDRVSLPPFSGSTLRGALASTFRRLSCQQPQRTDCHGCVLETLCAYPAVFEAGPPAGARNSAGFSSFPRPFVVVPPESGRTLYPAGSCLDAGLVLVGRGNNYLPYFLLALAQLASAGIGRGRGGVVVEHVEAYNPLTGTAATVWDGGDTPVKTVDLATTWEQIEAFARELPGDALQIRFTTPACLTAGGHMAHDPDFAVLVRCLLRRATRLAQGYCNTEPDLPYQEIIRRAEGVPTTASSLAYHGWERYSRRQDRRVPARGIIGTITYARPSPELLALVVLGSFIHVGDNAALGQGRYEVEASSAGATG